MNDMTGQAAKKTAQKTGNAAKQAETALDQRYRQIGISAVAAALRYQGEAKNPAYAPVDTRWSDDWIDAAA